jgi:hypothetical protein
MRRVSAQAGWRREWGFSMCSRAWTLSASLAGLIAGADPQAIDLAIWSRYTYLFAPIRIAEASKARK